MRLLRAAVATVAVLGLSACEELTNAAAGEFIPVPSELTGTWAATTAVVSDPSGTFPDVDLIAAGGAYSITLNEDGTFTQSATLPGEAPEVMTGTFTLSGLTSLALVPDGQQEVDLAPSFSIEGGTLTLSFSDTFDFDGDGTEEPAEFTLGLEKQ